MSAIMVFQVQSHCSARFLPSFETTKSSSLRMPLTNYLWHQGSWRCSVSILTWPLFKTQPLLKNGLADHQPLRKTQLLFEPSLYMDNYIWYKHGYSSSSVRVTYTLTLNKSGYATTQGEHRSSH